MRSALRARKLVLEVELRTSDTRSAAELGASVDKRSLGLAVVELRIDPE